MEFSCKSDYVKTTSTTVARKRKYKKRISKMYTYYISI